MDLTFWGVRGSIPAPGPEFNRYGGNTSCVCVRGLGGEFLILDAGTGIIELGHRLMAEGFGKGEGEASLFLTHGHWDHIQGFPFFGPAFVPGNRLTIHGSSRSPGMLEGIFEGQMNPHFMPVQSLRNLGAKIAFSALDADEERAVGGLRIRGRFNPHGSTRAFAFRIEETDGAGTSRSLVFAPDAGYPSGIPSDEMLDLYAGADVLVHDCTYTPEDRRVRVSRGYASIDIAARVAARAKVCTLAMFHYDQDYADDQVDALFERCRRFLDAEPGGDTVELVASREGMKLNV